VLVLVFFSLSPGKRGVYILPAVPALVLAAAPLLPGLLRRAGVRRVTCALHATLAIVPLAVAAVLLLAPAGRLAAVLGRYEAPPAPLLVAPLLLLAAGGAASGVVLRRRPAVALLAACAATWLVVGWWIQPLFNATRSAAPLMAAVNRLIGADGTLALVQWREQLVLFADRPVVHFGFMRSDAEREAREAARWAGAGPQRFVLLPGESLSPCFDPDRCTVVGRHVRREWYLAPAAAVTAVCRQPRP